MYLLFSFTMLMIGGVLALLAVNFVPIAALSSATSGGFLLVYAAVNVAAVRLASQTGSNRFVCALAAALCVVALVITVWQFLATPSTVSQALAILGIVVVSLAVELVFRIFEKVENTPRPA